MCSSIQTLFATLNYLYNKHEKEEYLMDFTLDNSKVLNYINKLHLYIVVARICNNIVNTSLLIVYGNIVCKITN